MAEISGELKRTLREIREAGVAERMPVGKRTGDFGRTRPDHATGAKSAQRRRSADDYGKAKMAMEARAKRDALAAEQATDEGRDVVIPEEEGYDHDRAIPWGVIYGEWNEDNLGADFGSGGFDDPEDDKEYREYRSLLEEIRLKKTAIELSKEHPKSGAKGEVRETFRGILKR